MVHFPPFYYWVSFAQNAEIEYKLLYAVHTDAF